MESRAEAVAERTRRVLRTDRAAANAARALAIALLAALLATRPAGAEQSGRGGMAVSLDGHISPNVLPRHGRAPVSVFLTGGVRSTNGTAPKRLRSIEIAFGSRGGLDVAGLPTCRLARLHNATARQALARCGEALVGHGSIFTEVPLAPERPLSVRASALVFNARSNGHPAAWVFAYSSSPPVSFVLPFTLRRLRHGTYGVALRAPVAHVLGYWPRLRSFQITLGRRYRAGGDRHSYLNARCPLPPRFDKIDAPFARATFSFGSSLTISQPISRPCAVRE